jgi:hypothetical protein
VAAPSAATAQDKASGATMPPKVLVIMREFLKPGTSGSVHEKSESAFVQAFTQANATSHYLAMDSLSGKSRALFFVGYDSFADWGKDLTVLQTNQTLAQAYDSAQEADGKLLSSYDSGVFTFQPDKSVGPMVNVGRIRYFEITRLKVRTGHDADFDALAKMHDSVFGKLPNTHYDMYAKYLGSESGGTYIVIAPLRSLEEIDQYRKDRHHAWASLSADQKKKMSDLETSTLESEETNLFAVNPKMSYARDNWRAADPGFWGQK